MGHGASSTYAKDEMFNPLFCNKELLQGRKCMADDDFSQAFIFFIKNGGWKETFPSYFRNEEYVAISLELLARGRICILYEYIFPRCRMEELIFACEQPPAPLKHEDSVNNPVPETYSPDGVFTPLQGMITQSTNAGECCAKCFSSSEHAGILFSALYGMFWSNTDCCESVMDVRSMGGSTIEESFGFHYDESRSTVPRNRPQRSAELLSEIASNISDADLFHELRATKWAENSWRPFEESSLCITIVDTLAPGFPFVYANKSFRRQMGFSKDVLDTPFGILTGLHTEELLYSVLIEAISQSKSARVGITLYNRRRQAMFYLVSVKAAGRYSVINYISTEDILREKELKMADEVLCLLTCIIKNVPPTMGTVPVKTATRRRRSTMVLSVVSPVPPRVDEAADTENSF